MNTKALAECVSQIATYGFISGENANQILCSSGRIKLLASAPLNLKYKREPAVISCTWYAHTLDLALKRDTPNAQTASPKSLFSYRHATKSISVTDGSVICLSISSR